MTRVPPHSSQAEQAVIGALMLAPEAWAKVGTMLTAEDFYESRHGLLWKAIAHLQDEGTPHDAVTLVDWLESHGIGNVVHAGGTAYIYKLANETHSAANVAAHAKIVREKAQLRRAIAALSEAQEKCWQADAEAVPVVDDAVRALMTLGQSQDSGETTMRQAAHAASVRLQEAYNAGGKLIGLTTGLIDVDGKLGGLHPGDLVVIGARPSMGKTAMLGGMVLAAARAGHAVGLISGEQPAEQIASRAVSAVSRVPAVRLRNADVEDEEWPRLTNAFAELYTLPVHILDRSAPSLAEVTRIARQWAHAHKIRALYVDYLQRITCDKEQRWEEVGVIARGLKGIARDLGIPVVVLAQVNRSVEQRGDKRPRMGDLANSSEIEKEADQILMLYRDEVYDAETENAGVAELIVEKNRHGPTGFIRLAWLGETMQFENYSRAA